MPLGFKKKKIYSKKTIGKYLSDKRLEKGITLLEAEQETRIRQKYLVALEENNDRCFPAEVYLFNFLRRYGEYLGLNPEELVRNYKFEQDFKKDINPVNKNQSNVEAKKSPFLRTNNKKLNIFPLILNPQIILSITVGIFVLGLLGYIWFQVKSFAAAPQLEIKNPSSEIVVSIESVKIEGKTDSSASININGETVAVDSNGFFVQDVRLNPGLNTIEITARNKADKESKKTIQVLAKY